MAKSLANKLKGKAGKGINPAVRPGASKIKVGNKPASALKPPTNTYDPNIDAQERAAQRGYDYLQGDLQLAGSRADQQHGIDTQLLQRGMDRGLGDIGTLRERLNQQYQTQTADLGRSYTRLGDSQAQAANAAGLVGGGTFAAALKARQENQGHDQSAIDTQHNQGLQDLATQEQRLREDYGPTDPNAAGYDLGRFGANDRGFAYGVNDRALQQQRAGTELGQFKIDSGNQRWYQAAGLGYVPPWAQKKPARKPEYMLRPGKPKGRRK